MTKDSALDLDLTVELRLRRWARLHHVPVAERRSDWHPVIHNEMQLRDREIRDVGDPLGDASRIVPLQETRMLRFDEPHLPVKGRRAGSAPTAAPAEFYYS